MNRFKNWLAVGAFSLLVLGIPAIASAQWGGGQYDPNNRNNSDPYGRNGGYNNGGYNNGQYGNYRNTRSVVRDLKSATRELQRHLDNDLDNSRYNGSRREDQLNDLAKQFRSSVNRLSESNNGPRDNDIQRVLDLGRQLDRYLSRTGVDYHIQETWNQIQNDLNQLDNSNGYDNSRNNRYPQTNNRYPQPNNRYPQTGNRRNLPSWWPF